MLVETQQQKKQNKKETRERKGQDATQITSAPAESCIQCLWPAVPISMTARTWMVKHVCNRTTIKNFFRRNRRCKICQTMQLLSHAEELRSFQSDNHDGPNTTLGRDVG